MDYEETYHVAHKVKLPQVHLRNILTAEELIARWPGMTPLDILNIIPKSLTPYKLIATHTNPDGDPIHICAKGVQMPTAVRSLVGSPLHKITFDLNDVSTYEKEHKECTWPIENIDLTHVVHEKCNKINNDNYKHTTYKVSVNKIVTWNDVEITLLRDTQTISILCDEVRQNHTFDTAWMDDHGKPSRSWKLLIAFIAAGGFLDPDIFDTSLDDVQTQISRLRKKLRKLLPHLIGDSIQYVNSNDLKGYKTAFRCIRITREPSKSSKEIEISEEVFCEDSRVYSGRVNRRGKDENK